MRKLLAALVTVFLAGCQSSPTVWERPGATVDDLQRDEAVCHDFVKKTWGTIPAGPLSREYFADCMRALGYTGRPPQPGETLNPAR